MKEKLEFYFVEGIVFQPSSGGALDSTIFLEFVESYDMSGLLYFWETSQEY